MNESTRLYKLAESYYKGEEHSENEERIIDWHAKKAKEKIDELLKEPKFKHLTFKPISGNIINDGEAQTMWNLCNHKLNVCKRLEHKELQILLEDLTKDSLIRRVLGLGYSNLFRSNIFFRP